MSDNGESPLRGQEPSPPRGDFDDVDLSSPPPTDQEITIGLLPADGRVSAISDQPTSSTPSTPEPLPPPAISPLSLSGNQGAPTASKTPLFSNAPKTTSTEPRPPGRNLTKTSRGSDPDRSDSPAFTPLESFLSPLTTPRTLYYTSPYLWQPRLEIGPDGYEAPPDHEDEALHRHLEAITNPPSVGMLLEVDKGRQLQDHLDNCKDREVQLRWDEVVQYYNFAASGRGAALRVLLKAHEQLRSKSQEIIQLQELLTMQAQKQQDLDDEVRRQEDTIQDQANELKEYERESQTYKANTRETTDRIMNAELAQARLRAQLQQAEADVKTLEKYRHLYTSLPVQLQNPRAAQDLVDIREECKQLRSENAALLDRQEELESVIKAFRRELKDPVRRLSAGSMDPSSPFPSPFSSSWRSSFNSKAGDLFPAAEIEQLKDLKVQLNKARAEWEVERSSLNEKVYNLEEQLLQERAKAARNDEEEEEKHLPLKDAVSKLEGKILELEEVLKSNEAELVAAIQENTGIVDRFKADVRDWLVSKGSSTEDESDRITAARLSQFLDDQRVWARTLEMDVKGQRQNTHEAVEAMQSKIHTVTGKLANALKQVETLEAEHQAREPSTTKTHQLQEGNFLPQHAQLEALQAINRALAACIEFTDENEEDEWNDWDEEDEEDEEDEGDEEEGDEEDVQARSKQVREIEGRNDEEAGGGWEKKPDRFTDKVLHLVGVMLAVEKKLKSTLDSDADGIALAASETTGGLIQMINSAVEKHVDDGELREQLKEELEDYRDKLRKQTDQLLLATDRELAEDPQEMDVGREGESGGLEAPTANQPPETTRIVLALEQPQLQQSSSGSGTCHEALCFCTLVQSFFPRGGHESAGYGYGHGHGHGHIAAMHGHYPSWQWLCRVLTAAAWLMLLLLIQPYNLYQTGLFVVSWLGLPTSYPLQLLSYYLKSAAYHHRIQLRRLRLRRSRLKGVESGDGAELDDDAEAVARLPPALIKPAKPAKPQFRIEYRVPSAAELVSTAVALAFAFTALAYIAVSVERAIWLEANQWRAAYLRDILERRPYPAWSPFDIDFRLLYEPAWSHFRVWVHGLYFRASREVRTW